MWTLPRHRGDIKENYAGERSFRIRQNRRYAAGGSTMVNAHGGYNIVWNRSDRNQTVNL